MPAPLDTTVIDDAAVGARLAAIRQVTGRIQKDFAARAGLANNRYNQYEMGKKRLSIEAAMKLCDAYELTLDYIYRGEPSGLKKRTIDALDALRAHKDADTTTQ